MVLLTILVAQDATRVHHLFVVRVIDLGMAGVSSEIGRTDDPLTASMRHPEPKMYENQYRAVKRNLQDHRDRRTQVARVTNRIRSAF
jgi:hypothetical protein